VKYGEYRHNSEEQALRGRALLRVIDYFAKLLKVTEKGTIRKLGYGFLFGFHSNYGRIFSCFDTIHERDRQTPASQPPSHCTTA